MKNSIIPMVVMSIFILSLNTGCKEIIAKNITSVIPVLITPTVNDTVQINPVQIKWMEVDGATRYRLQVVTPGFSNISYYTLDTLVNGTEFYTALDSAKYELKLTAVNSGYTSQTIGPVPFWVGVKPSSGAGTSISLSTPVSNAYLSGNFSGPFSWGTLTSATSYEFSLREGNEFATGNQIHFQNSISTTTINLPGSVILTEGAYSWGVKGYLSNGVETNYSTRIFYIDVTNPNTPAGVMIPSSTFETGTVNFSWSNGTDTGVIQSPVTSIIQITSDSGFSSIWTEQSLQGNSISVDMSSATPGIYYWRVSNRDEAGNISSYSTINQFNLN